MNFVTQKTTRIGEELHLHVCTIQYESPSQIKICASKDYVNLCSYRSISIMLHSKLQLLTLLYKEPMQVTLAHYSAVKTCMDDHTIKGGQTNCVARHFKTGFLDALRWILTHSPHWKSALPHCQGTYSDQYPHTVCRNQTSEQKVSCTLTNWFCASIFHLACEYFRLTLICFPNHW